MRSKVAVLKTSPAAVLVDYHKLMNLADYSRFLPRERDTVIKLNLSWTKYFPACSSQPWQLEGAVKTLIDDGYSKESLFPVENKTVVTNPLKGAINNKWMPVLNKYGLGFTPLPEVEWVLFKPKAKLMVLDSIFPEGILIPKMFLGKNVLHLPTVKTHGHSITTGAIKNSFGGLLKEVRHYCHKYMHETLVDLMILQKEIHSGIFAVMDGTVAGDGAGPRTMIPHIKDYILASGDSVAIDAVAAKMMGMDPMSIPYLRMCDEKGLGNARMENVDLVGDDISGVNFEFTASRSFVIWGDQMIRKGFLKPFEKLLLHSPLMVWAPFASNVYHDFFWYPTVGRNRITSFSRTGWGELFRKY
ncbi:MAG: DUF362 domain-containing protein [Actinobacteria bacterium]|nr:DUF362 domain-containing protein [Actinomycetota bacterium]